MRAAALRMRRQRPEGAPRRRPVDRGRHPHLDGRVQRHGNHRRRRRFRTGRPGRSAGRNRPAGPNDDTLGHRTELPDSGRSGRPDRLQDRPPAQGRLPGAGRQPPHGEAGDPRGAGRDDPRLLGRQRLDRRRGLRRDRQAAAQAQRRNRPRGLDCRRRRDVAPVRHSRRIPRRHLRIHAPARR